MSISTTKKKDVRLREGVSGKKLTGEKYGVNSVQHTRKIFVSAAGSGGIIMGQQIMTLITDNIINMKIKVKSLYKGMCGIRDKYLKDLNEDLEIFYLGKKMTIKRSELDEKIIGKTKEVFWDKFKNEYHHLVYFKWTEDPDTQPKLL